MKVNHYGFSKCWLRTFLLKSNLSLNSNNYQERVKLQKNMDMKHVFEEPILDMVNTEIIFAVNL